MKTSVKIFGVRIDNVTLEDAFKQFVTFLKREKTAAIYTPNPEIVLLAQENVELKRALLDGELVVPDGIGLIYASKIHKLGLKERVPGIDLMERVLKFLNTTKGSIYILGGKPEVADVAAFHIVEEFPNIMIKGTKDGYFDDEEELKIIDHINEVKPDVLFVCLGAPRQELWIHKHKNILSCKVAMGVGGSVDIWAGHVKRAPKWMQNMGLEWFHRLIIDPSRLKRMLRLPLFMLKVVTTRKI
ncbi:MULTISPECIES: WecB/TagA/CpsF family glycosyltransferase [unclassified Fusibacter]|uniref:WecB/TagA/CpsF family glycosyltransferase n=1 Tax=unclassified Fusibacter TaxID=2624464 RepID=UPI001010B9DF|nr:MULTISPECIES: WecB/TagA/CpsF family glycosyltransferase [unclassified Fusibacter]MCK8060550.1 WecB/TagA/CpsF family glycosyltransferase [Fusibacter sp. A2]NPE22996.1 WecB/TagA/CpsF family glycosyltransferase [Fusibacter sp. A1]RXV60061.1 glycosyltransferase [Fusibacter sp. A1]